MAQVRINKRQLEEWMKGNLPRSVGRELRAVADEIQARAQLLAPQDTGALQQSIRVEQSRNVRGQFASGWVIKADVPYSKVQDQGSGPQHEDFVGNPSPRAGYYIPTQGPRGGILAKWARRKGFSIFELRDVIKERGTKPTHFMGEAYTTAKNHSALFRNRRR